jgi:hypothetical protein
MSCDIPGVRVCQLKYHWCTGLRNGRHAAKDQEPLLIKLRTGNILNLCALDVRVYDNSVSPASLTKAEEDRQRKKRI